MPAPPFDHAHRVRLLRGKPELCPLCPVPEGFTAVDDYDWRPCAPHWPEVRRRWEEDSKARYETHLRDVAEREEQRRAEEAAALLLALAAEDAAHG